METTDFKINLPLSFEQVVDIIRQLSVKEKRKLTEILKKESNKYPENNQILTHISSEDVLSKDWLSDSEDEAWKNL